MGESGKKYIKTYDTNDDNIGKDELWCAWYKCRNCKGTMIIRNTKYCPDCGLKINWLEYKTIK